VNAVEVFRYSGRALTGHRLRSVLSLLGVAIGIAAVVLLTALGEGARRYVLTQFAQIGANFVAIVPGKIETTGGIPGLGGAPNDLTLDDALALRRALPSARYVAPFVVGTESVEHGDRRRQVLVVGATSEFQPVRRLEIGRGRFLPETDYDRGAPVAVLGDRVARELFPYGEALGRVARVGDRRFKVIGVLSGRGEQLGIDLDEVVIVPVATAMAMFDRRSLFRILVEAEPGVSLDAVKARALELLVARHGEEDVTLLTEDAIMASLSSILTALTLALGAIAAISLAVAGVGIMNVMLVSVSERTAEIGLLRAVGASRAQIRLCLVTEAALLSAAGGLVGLLAGWLGTRLLVGIWPALPATPPAWAVGSAIVLSLVVGTLFGWLPARRASRLEPVAALTGR